MITGLETRTPIDLIISRALFYTNRQYSHRVLISMCSKQTNPLITYTSIYQHREADPGESGAIMGAQKTQLSSVTQKWKILIPCCTWSTLVVYTHNKSGVEICRGGTIFPSRVSGRGYKIGPVCASVCVSVCLSVSAHFGAAWSHYFGAPTGAKNGSPRCWIRYLWMAPLLEPKRLQSCCVCMQ